MINSMELKIQVTCEREECHNTDRKEMGIICIRCIYGKYKLLLTGCSDPEHTQDDEDCFCNECSMGENPDECAEFRKENKLVLR